jgi:hypothetical protein
MPFNFGVSLRVVRSVTRKRVPIFSSWGAGGPGFFISIQPSKIASRVGAPRCA